MSLCWTNHKLNSWKIATDVRSLISLLPLVRRILIFFPVDSEAENMLELPSLDSFMKCCLAKRYGSKASFARITLYTQPAWMVEEISYKGQHAQAARLGHIIQLYTQQILIILLLLIQNEDSFSDGDGHFWHVYKVPWSDRQMWSISS